jgi:hypothetical protein
VNGNGGTTRIEQFNQLIRGIVVLALVFGMIYGFIWSKVVSTESFMIVAILVFNWWFKSRDDEKKDAVVKAAPPAEPQKS